MMREAYLGFDTSNYTTSLGLYYPDDGSYVNVRRLLSVEGGERGLRQSEALFQHVRQLPELIRRLDLTGVKIAGVGCSARPRDVEGSYMPCFLAGRAAAFSAAKPLNLTVHEFSHQAGHVAAEALTCGEADILDKPFLSFHASGGTTELLYVEPAGGSLKIKLIASTLDLNAGQVVDRVGLKMGLSFPCGRELERIASGADKKLKPFCFLRDGGASFSGIESKCEKLLEQGETEENVALFCLSSIGESIKAMCLEALRRNPGLKILFAGGVMSDLIIRDMLSSGLDALFGSAELSSDNAVGIAYLAYLKENL